MKLQLDEDGLRQVVHAFYARVRDDLILGPVFLVSVTDWGSHLETLTSFWSSVILSSGRYRGRPVPAHFRHRAEITPEMFERWLHLWGETVDELMEPPAAALLRDRAARIGEALSFALFSGARASGAGDSAS